MAEAAVRRQIETDSALPLPHGQLSRIYLLHSQWESALEEARAAYDADALGEAADLGAAYLARGLAQRRPRDLQWAIEHLSNVLSRNPADPIGLFNRAIALERLFLFHRAEADCQAYLRVDAASGWAEEVRERLSRIQKVLGTWQGKLEWLSGSEDVYLQAGSKAPPEVFLHSASTEWLSDLAGSDSNRARKAHDALTLLAEQLSKRHRDRWLSVLLSNPEPAGGLIALAEAIRANEAGRRGEGLRYARTARQLFEDRSNFAGAARARMEEIYALSRSFQLGTCLNAAADLVQRVEGHHFPWIEGQLRMEEAVCSFNNGEFKKALERMERALKEIGDSGYETLNLRGLGLQASFRTLLGDTASATVTNWRGLELFWQAIHPPTRAYQFYSDLYLAAEREQRWTSARAFAQEAVDTISLGPNRLMEAMARTRLAAFCLRTGDNSMALEQTQLSAVLLEPFGAMPSAREYKLENQIVLTSAYLAAGETGKAATTLAAIRSESDGNSVLMRLALHRTRGLLHSQEQDWQQAKQEFLIAADIGGLPPAILATMPHASSGSGKPVSFFAVSRGLPSTRNIARNQRWFPGSGFAALPSAINSTL